MWQLPNINHGVKIWMLQVKIFVTLKFEGLSNCSPWNPSRYSLKNKRLKFNFFGDGNSLFEDFLHGP